MPATITRPREPDLLVFGWELHCTSLTSDKFYRIFLVDNIVLINFGRRGTQGNFLAHTFLGQNAAQEKAKRLTNEKAREGYQRTRDLTVFELNPAQFRLAGELVPGTTYSLDADKCAALVDTFKRHSKMRGTELKGASA